MRKLSLYLRSPLAPAAAGLTAVCLSLSVAVAGSAARAIATPHAVPATAALFVLDSTVGDPQNPLYFQVVGQGFRPGERVTVEASLAAPARDSQVARPLLPVQVIANDYGQVAATLDERGDAGANDGFVIRAIGDQHAAGVVDLVLPGASYTAPGGK